MVNGSKAVLIVDDDAQFQKSFSDMLQKMGFIVSVADTGENAIEAFSPDPNQTILKKSLLDEHKHRRCSLRQ